MRMRPFIWAAALVGGFWYATSVANWNPGRLWQPIRQAERLWMAPNAAHSAGFSADENNNIEIYKLGRPAAANITNIVYLPGVFLFRGLAGGRHRFGLCGQAGRVDSDQQPCGLGHPAVDRDTGRRQEAIQSQGARDGPAQRPGAGENTSR